MNNPELYNVGNSLQSRDAELVISEYGDRIKWKKFGRDEILDIGCGDGYVTSQLLLKACPRNISRLLGVDISTNMVKYANSKYSSEKLQFSFMDIADNVDLHHVAKFDHIFSFFCLHWIPDQIKVISNIYTLLKPGGDCLLSMSIDHPICHVHDLMRKEERWLPYMQTQMVSPYRGMDDPIEFIKNCLQRTGFETIHVCKKERFFNYKSIQQVKDSALAIDPYIVNMPPKVAKVYASHYENSLYKFNWIQHDQEMKCNFIRWPYSTLVVYASKRYEYEK